MRRIDKLVREWKEEGLLLPIWMENDRICLANQHALPLNEETLTISEVSVLAEAIKDMTIRGSGAIAIAGAYGFLLEALQGGDKDSILRAGKILRQTRETAVNLLKTIDQLSDCVRDYQGTDLAGLVEEKVCDVLARQLRYEKQLGTYGAELIRDGDAILTHCHSGAIAGSGYGGRALSVIRKAHEQGKQIHVYVSETRPYLQGARITAYELGKFRIPHTLITDGMSGYLMRSGMIQKVVVGSDRVTACGDLINKIGTYMHALAAKANNVPFYTATSIHTIDFEIQSGMGVPVEYRDSEEVTHFGGIPIAAPGTKAVYPSFDVTPSCLISAIVTEQGVIAAPFGESLAAMKMTHTDH